MLAHPRGHKWHEREPEQQVQVRPENRPRHTTGAAQHVVMVVPVDAEEYETEYVAEQDREQWAQGGGRGVVGRSQFENHDGDDDR
jgi:hypothetical protein